MLLFNRLSSAVFDVVLAPFGHGFAAFDLLVWPALAGIVALLVYKHVSNQAGISRAKNGIMVHLLEVVLYRDDLIGVLVSTAKALGQNMLYLGFNIFPMVVMFLPMTAVLVQIVSNYAYSPVPVGEPVLVEVQMADKAAAAAVSLTAPEGVTVEAGPVSSPDGFAAWRVRAPAGDYSLSLASGSETETKGLAVGGEPRKLPIMRTNTWEAFLYPGEEALSGDSAFETIRIRYPDRDLPLFPNGESGILGWYFVFSLAAGFALKDRFGVTL